MPATTKPETVISLWLDRTSDPADPHWIVSEDQIEPTGGSATSQTLISYPRVDYDLAKTSAISKGKARRLRVLEYFPDHAHRVIHDPAKKS